MTTFMFFSSSGLCEMKHVDDDKGVRYTLVGDNPGSETNWLFLPGGPGADSRYLLTLVEILDIPGKIWLIDFPGSGDNPAPKGYDFQNWLHLLPTIVSQFPNCILVGHSLGGMLPLLSPELEEQLLGLVIINSAPSLWTEASAKLFKQHKIPALPEREAFFKDQTQNNFDKMLLAYIPYYINKDALSKGYEMFKGLPFPVYTMLTVFGLMQKINYNARWIPQKVPTLIIGGEQDYINPFSLFENDHRFDRKNIKKVMIKGCGHWCWLEKPGDVRQLFAQFYEKHINKKKQKSDE